MRVGRYILDENANPVREPDPAKWAEWLEREENIRVALDTVRVHGFDWKVSTVFLGLDHGHGRKGPPVLFETATQDPTGHTSVIARYETRALALDGHRRAVESLTLPPEDTKRKVTA